MYLVWALEDGGTLNRKRFCQASLRWFAILVGIGTTLAVMGGALALLAF